PPITFFPPILPIYGAEIQERAGTSARWFNGRRLVAPDGMADFVAESFYPALATRLFVPELSPALETKIENYRPHRRRLTNALLDKIVELHDADAETRAEELRKFAAVQTPDLVTLETEAESVRDALVAKNIDWNVERRWKLGTLKPGDWTEKQGEFQV